MKNLSYKGYTGTIEYSPEDDLFFGKVLGVQSLISYEGKTGKELENDFRGALNEYLKECKAHGREPEKPYKGSFNVRITSKLHQQAALMAQEQMMSLNNFVAESIRDKIARESGNR